MRIYSNEKMNKYIDDGKDSNFENQESFEQLLNLLEESAKKVEFLSEQKEKEKSKLMVGILIMYSVIPILFLLKNRIFYNEPFYLNIGIIVGSVIALLFIYFKIVKMRGLRRRIFEESRMLEKLLYLTHEYKENIPIYKSYMARILFEIRIERIEFMLKNRKIR